MSAWQKVGNTPPPEGVPVLVKFEGADTLRDIGGGEDWPAIVIARLYRHEATGTEPELLVWRYHHTDQEDEALAGDEWRLLGEVTPPPAFYVDPEDPDRALYPHEVSTELERDLWPGDVRRIETYYAGPDVFTASVPVTYDEDGDPDEAEVRWYDTEGEARAAANRTAEAETES